MSDVNYDVVVVGGSLGGVAAALRAAQAGAMVALLESGSWLGGQYTAQGVSTPDENRYIETVGSANAYRSFRHAVRAYYRNNYHLSALGANQPQFNPGGNYPGFSLEPKVGHIILQQQILATPNLHLRLNTAITTVETQGDSLVSVTGVDSGGTTTRYLAAIFLDATDLGDLLPLANVEYRLGAESKAQTGEPDAADLAHPEWIQPITIPFALERRPGNEDNTISRPANYDALKATQKYTLLDGYISKMFAPGKDMWSYRRFIASANFNDPAFPYDLTMINTGSNDYQTATIPTGDSAQDAAIIAAARQASLGYLYWLQTECPRDDDSTRFGYPELKLRMDVFDTPDGTAPQPYIRESRRIQALKTIVQQELDADYNPGPRAALFPDSCGIGFYSMDVHGLASVGMQGVFKSTRPYQIPLRALIPIRVTNLLAACKNIGTTHITNGAYRLHPIEWNIGEAAGALAAFCIQKGVSARAVPDTPDLLREFQHSLLDAGVPLFWWSDISDSHPAYVALNLLGVKGILSGYPDMSFRPNNLLTGDARQIIAANVQAKLGQNITWPSGNLTRGSGAQWLAAHLGL